MESGLVQSDTNLTLICATQHGVTFRNTIFYITDICSLSYFELFYLLILGVEGILHLITPSDTHTHTHTLGRTPLDEGSDS